MIDQAVSVEADLDARVAAFEHDWQSAGSADLRVYLPEPDAPHYRQVLCELLRCDLELHWSHGQPGSLDEYRTEFPEAFDDAKQVSELAFEEYRQRVRAGRAATPQEYAERYGLDVSDWPTPDDIVNPTVQTAVSDSPVEDPEYDEAVRELTRVAPAAAARLELSRRAMPKAGDQFLRFELLRELGCGAFGRVFLARQKDLANRLVALKVTADLGGESQKLARLQHTNIVPIYSVHLVNTLQAICMPFLGSLTLESVIRGLAVKTGGLPETGRELLETLYDGLSLRKDEGGRMKDEQKKKDSSDSSFIPHPSSFDSSPSSFPPSTAALDALARLSHVDAALWIVKRLADGLAHAHEKGILHRDLKPANILLTDDGQPMLLDFNVSADVASPGAATKATVGGTVLYMAPEHLEAFRDGSGSLDGRCDLYSLGIILYELLTGKFPWVRPAGKIREVLPQVLAQRRCLPTAPRQLNPAISPAVNAIVLKLLEPDPRRRYASANHLSEDLECHLANRPLLHARDRSPVERFRKWRRRNPRLAVATGVAATVFTLFVVPATTFGALQYQKAEERLTFERAEMALKQQKALRDIREAQIYLSTQRGDRDFIDRGFVLAEKVLKRYGVGDDPQWAERPSVKLLSPERRDELQLEFGELLLLMARGERFRAPKEDAEPLASRWKQLAEACFPSNLRRSVNDEYHEGLEAAQRGQYGEALAKLQPFTERHPRHFMAWHIRGVCDVEVGELADAVAAFTVCSGIDDEFHLPYLWRGLARLEQKRFAKAEADFSIALEKKPNWDWALKNRAIARKYLRDWQGAEGDLTELLALAKAPTQAYFIRAEVRKAAGNVAGADRDIEAGKQTTPTDALSWVTRGYWREQAKDLKGALQDYEAALAINPRMREALQNKSVVLADFLNQPKAALAVMDQLLELYPQHVEALGGRAVYLGRLGDSKRVRADVQACLAAEPTPFRYYQMAGAYAQLTRFPGNETATGQALELLAKAFRNGFGDFALLDTDTDLDPLRKNEEFYRIVAHARALHTKK